MRTKSIKNFQIESKVIMTVQIQAYDKAEAIAWAEQNLAEYIGQTSGQFIVATKVIKYKKPRRVK